MTKQEVYSLCLSIAPTYGLDPYLVLAICEQESGYKPFARRLENGFFVKYTEPMSLDSTSEVLLATSYGLTQMMGESLLEAGYFRSTDAYNYNATTNTPDLSDMGIARSLNMYCSNPAAQIKWGCVWFKRKLDTANLIEKGGVPKALQLWNGGGNPDYAKQVLARYDKLKLEGL
jgi:hypothetical protein